MNKLYKYLPFNIKGEVETPHFEGIEIGELVALKMYKYSISSEEGLYDVIVTDLGLVQNCLSFKPILRSFSDLTKELPLTKAAAEMIGREAEEIVSIYGIVELIHTYSINNFIQQNGISRVDMLHTWAKPFMKDNKVFINKFKKYCFNIDTLSFENDCINSSIKTEQVFDFLRSMHFAVDFSEDEYIKLED